ncbi:hypothetical protein [Synoicihabitans lomoniglobus]|uniref:Uncharacterized protein n=1 Tax=Synoicihabitans lomoniglobus TaxID=2909285 RepID=A0AAF0I477_9BACT|nr:hypothetical protein [Opitutaceae bacterium LMO-M01]WED67482.1 hypothetical protein PXH66_11535 [Opitutaceae bacterium LMO-M01]
MSLINEALKKAQKQRQDEAAAASGKIAAPGLGQPTAPPPPPPPPVIAPASAAPDPDPEPSPMVAARQKRGANGGILRFAAMALVAVVVIGLVITFWGRDGEAPAVSTTVAVSDPPPTAEVVEAPVAVTMAAPAPAPSDPATPPPSHADSSVTETMVDQSATPPASIEVPAPGPDTSDAPTRGAIPVRTDSVPQPVVTTESSRYPPPPVNVAINPAPASSPTAEPVSTPSPQPRSPMTPAASGSVTILSQAELQATARAVPSSQPSLAPSEAVLNYLERSRVTGVRASATDPKVLMNDRVFRLNDVVDRDLQLRVIEIDPRQLKFRDPQGYVYTKSF